MDKLEPEFGQMCFGQPWQQFEASELLIAALRAIQRKLDLVMWNKHQVEYDSPFYNTGNTFSNKVFDLAAYSWDETKEQKYNFKWKDIEISWYKNVGRSTSVNKDMSSAEIEAMLNDCLQSLEEFDKETEKQDRIEDVY